MDSEFPTLEEEYELLHQDEYEVLREIEVSQKKKQLSQTDPSKLSQSETNKSNDADLNKPSTNKCEQYGEKSTADGTKKRTYEELFGDISDVLDIDELSEFCEPQDKKPRWDQPDEIIKLVLDAREKLQHQNKGVSAKRKYCGNEKKDSISLRIPSWNFVAVTRSYDGQRLYVRVRNERYTASKDASKPSNLLSVPYSQLKAQAEEIIIKKVERSSVETSAPSVNGEGKNDELWVDKYRPKSYIELLSDESVNRNLLHWIKLWDKVVFNRNFVPKKKKEFRAFGRKKTENEAASEEVDSQGFPIQKIALLSGPPGLGKTTLAHLAVKHAGYNVVEINASDERSPDAFRQVLLASTQMKAVMGSDPRPNCLVLDEIDGAPTASIELLLKFVQGKLVPKGKKDKDKTAKQTCQRPVICICNEPYTPSLRPLRAVALTIAVPEVSPARLADRLIEISRMENLKVNPDALLKLAEISGCDVRSCLGALQYMGGAKLGDNLSFALKDSRKGLFDSWKQILTIPMDRTGRFPIPKRVNAVLKTVQNGESEKLAQGVFHNYPVICNEKLSQLYVCLEWFQFFDEILSLVGNLQVWSIMPYTNYAFVLWHLYFAKTRNIKLSYPSVTYEVNQKQARSVGILKTIQRSSGRDVITLATDIAPFLPDLLSPRLRTVSGHLLSSNERADIARLVNVLLDFGLTFVQEKNLDGNYEYKVDPNIFEIGIFAECKTRHMLVYAVKQIIAQELEAERLRRAANITGIGKEVKQNGTNRATKEITQTNRTVPEAEREMEISRSDGLGSSKDINKLNGQLKEVKYKDFFGRPVTINYDKQQNSDKGSTASRDFLTKHGVWYKYKEGYSNAVRRNVFMKDL